MAMATVGMGRCIRPSCGSSRRRGLTTLPQGGEGTLSSRSPSVGGGGGTRRIFSCPPWRDRMLRSPAGPHLASLMATRRSALESTLDRRVSLDAQTLFRSAPLDTRTLVLRAPLDERSGVEARWLPQARRAKEREQRLSLQPAEAVILRGRAWRGLMRGGRRRGWLGGGGRVRPRDCRSDQKPRQHGCAGSAGGTRDGRWVRCPGQGRGNGRGTSSLSRTLDRAVHPSTAARAVCVLWSVHGRTSPLRPMVVPPVVVVASTRPQPREPFRLGGERDEGGIEGNVRRANGGPR